MEKPSQPTLAGAAKTRAVRAPGPEAVRHCRLPRGSPLKPSRAEHGLIPDSLVPIYLQWPAAVRSQLFERLHSETQRKQRMLTENEVFDIMFHQKSLCTHVRLDPVWNLPTFILSCRMSQETWMSVGSQIMGLKFGSAGAWEKWASEISKESIGSFGGCDSSSANVATRGHTTRWYATCLGVRKECLHSPNLRSVHEGLRLDNSRSECLKKQEP